MAADKTALSHRLKMLGGDLTTFWRPMRQKVTDEMYQVALLQKFFKAMQSSMKEGETSEAAYYNALGVLPKDNKDTPLYEGVSEGELKEKFQNFFKKPLDSSVYGNIESLDTLIGSHEPGQPLSYDPQTLEGKIRYYVAQQLSMESSINAVQSEIDNLRNILKTSSVSTD